jgi:hypothetical protein
MLDSMTEQYCTGDSEETSKMESAEGYPKKTCRKALEVFYATCKEKGWDYSKPMPREMVREHFTAIMPFQVLEKVVDKPLRIRGVAIKAGVSRNMNIYTPKELESFASKLEGAPFYVEHVAVPNAIGKVVKAWWDPQTQAVWYEAEIYDDELAEKIRKGIIQHVSIGADYETLDLLDGKVPHGLHNAELSLVAVPGIPETNIQVLESYAPTGVSAQGRKPLKERENVNENENKPPVLRPFIAERVWTRRYINDLPDSSFALILPGGEKDETGRTKPRSLRMFPYKDAEGRVDLPHLRNANARLPQAKIPEEQREKARRVLVAVKKKLGIGASTEEAKLYEEINADEVVPGKIEALPEPTLDELVASLEDALDEIWNAVEGLNKHLEAFQQSVKEKAEAKMDDAKDKKEAKLDNTRDVKESLVQKPKEPMMPVAEAIRILEGLLPSPAVERSTLGMQRMCQDIRRAIWQLRERVKNV